MKAIVYHNYGSPDVLQCEEFEKPTAGDNEVLIKVRAASVSPLDWHYMRGTPYIVRIKAGLGKPKITRLGVDVAGQVEAVGRNVTQFKPGDKMFGTCHGAFAEYACTSESALVMKPDNVTFEQAASVPVAAFTALQGLRDKGQIQPGQKVLNNGAAGGVGTFAVQIAKSFGADVTGVCERTKLMDVLVDDLGYLRSPIEVSLGTGVRKITELLELRIEHVNSSGLSVFRPANGRDVEVRPNWLLLADTKGKGPRHRVMSMNVPVRTALHKVIQIEPPDGYLILVTLG